MRTFGFKQTGMNSMNLKYFLYFARRGGKVLPIEIPVFSRVPLSHMTGLAT